MSREPDSTNPLRMFFQESLHEALAQKVGLPASDEVERYLADLLVGFLHYEQIFALRDFEGRRIETLADMLLEGDVRAKAPNFDREREVHRHIGDFLLFWSGLFPEMLPRLRGFATASPEEEARRQGQFSYSIVSSFDHAPYGLEAALFKRLSEEFDACMQGLRLLRASFEGFRLQGFGEGFEA